MCAEKRKFMFVTDPVWGMIEFGFVSVQNFLMNLNFENLNNNSTQ